MNRLLQRSSLILPRSLKSIRLCTLSLKEQFVSDSEDSLDLCSSVHFQANPSWFDEVSDSLETETAVSINWNEEKIDGKKREEETDVAKLFISEEIVSRLAQRGITKLFPIQRVVLGPAMQGRDMICRAKTGTGKTLAYGIPIMDKIIRLKATQQAKRRRGRNPLALVLTPTRELSRQVEKEFKDSSSLKTVSIYGGEQFARKLNELNYGVDVLVGTPGRINDLLTQNVLSLSHVQFVVLDESDQLLAVSFAEIVEKILGRLPRRRQSIMFSSTMPAWMTEFQGIYLNNPLIIDLVGDCERKLPDGITFYSIESDDYRKPSMLIPLIMEHVKGGKCIIFAQSKRVVNYLSEFIASKCQCEPLHADMHQNHREKTLASFCDGNFNVLVATDVAARGLHIPDIDLVIHYDVPLLSETFAHRTGRTGRAGKTGKVIIVHTEEQTEDLRNIEQDLCFKFEKLPRMKVEDGGQLMHARSSGSILCSYPGSQRGGSDFQHLSGKDVVKSRGYGITLGNHWGSYDSSGFDGPRSFARPCSGWFNGSDNSGYRHAKGNKLISGHYNVSADIRSRFCFSDTDHSLPSHVRRTGDFWLRRPDSIHSDGSSDARVGHADLGEHVSEHSDDLPVSHCPNGFVEPDPIHESGRQGSLNYSTNVGTSGSAFGSFCHDIGNRIVNSASRGHIELGIEHSSDSDGNCSACPAGSHNSDLNFKCSKNPATGFGSFVFGYGEDVANSTSEQPDHPNSRSTLTC